MAEQNDPGSSDLGNNESDQGSQQDGFKEFERLDSLLSQLPKKAQHGILKSCDLVLTCIDANKKYIALGTNIGMTFLYSRIYKTMQRLKATKQGTVITAVCLHDGVDDLVAVGSASGEVTVFCIPGLISVQKKQIQKFEVPDAHAHYITCLEWSTNGMKLFSGDKTGQVCVSEIDFYHGVCKSFSLLIEPSTEITQMDYQNRVLLVSTRQRSFVVRLDRTSETFQIGSQERKIPGQFGACFIPDLCKPDDVKLYAARPGCRLWLADAQGSVKSTHIFRDPLTSGVPEIPLLAAGKLQTQQEGFQFGKLLWMRNNNLVSWSSSALVILDPDSNRCVCRQGKLSGIEDVAVISETEEIFLLRRHADARVIRISNKPEVIEKEEIKSSSITASDGDTATLTKTQQKEQPSALSFFKRLGFKKQEDQPPTVEPERKTHEIITEQSELPPVMEILPAELERIQLFSSQDGAEKTHSPLVQGPLESSQIKKSSPAENNTDIVFSHKMKKPKKKKYKQETPKSKEVEIDTVSQQSNDSAASSSVNVSFNSEDESALRTLREADKMLSLVRDIVKKEDKVRSEPLSGVLPMALGTDGQGTSELENSVTDNASFNDQVNTSQSTQSVEQVVETPETFASFTEQLKSEKSGQRQLPFTPVPTDIVSQVSTESIQENISIVANVAKDSFPQDSDRFPKNAQNNQQSVHMDSDTNNEHVYNTSLSEVDQHMEVAAGLKDSLHEKETVSDGSFVDSSATVDSALARVTGEIFKEEENLEKGISGHLPKDLPRHGEESAHMSKKDGKDRFPLVYQQSFADIYMDFDAVENMDYFKDNDKSENAGEDFYSKYSDVYSNTQEASKFNKAQDPSFPSKFATDTHSQDVRKTASHLANSWSEITAPTNIYSLAVSDNHVWFTDKGENIYYSSLQGSKGIVWRKATGYASQIAVSPSGSIVWRLYKGVVYAGTKISTRHPEGLKWVEAVREVQYIAVSNNCAWFIKRSGDLMVQQGLSKERPCFRSRQVDCGPYRLKQVACGGEGVVWGITEGLQLLVRTGATRNLPVGDAWEACVRESPPYLFSHVTIDNENVGWAIDVTGRVWFCLGVTLENPKGTSDWLEVPVSGYVMQEASMLDMIRAAAKIFDPTKLSYIMSSNRGGLVSAGSQGIWLAMDSRNLLQVCRGTLQGYNWIEAQPARMASTTMWKHVCASMNHLDHGLVWTQHLKKDIFALKKARGEAHNIVDCENLACISAAPLAVWTLSSEGQIKLRTGIGPACPHGSGWLCLNLAQLGDAHFVHLSCNSSYVWAVEAEGRVYQRIGTSVPSDTDLNPVWLPIDTFGDVCFSKVFVSPLDWMVWAIDNRRLCFVRVGITESMPLGREWVHVPGIQAVDMTITKTGIWALNTHGEIFFRYGIALDNPTGDYWKKIPGTLIKISASEDDELWGINPDGQLMYCKVKLLPRRQKSTEAFPAATLTRDMSVNEDWEIV